MRVSEEQIILNALTVIDDEALEQERMAIRKRRLERALQDLGLKGVLGEEWSTLVGSDLCFAPLRGQRADKLVTALERLAEAAPRRAPVPASPRQLRLF